MYIIYINKKPLNTLYFLGISSKTKHTLCESMEIALSVPFYFGGSSLTGSRWEITWPMGFRCLSTRIPPSNA